MRLLRLLPALLTAAAVVFPAPAAQASDVVVDMKGFQFIPAVTVAEVGQTIVWKNTEPVSIPTRDMGHNVFLQTKDASTNSKLLFGKVGPGGSGTAVAGGPDLPRGTYTYTCAVDLDHTVLMHGVLIVR